MTELIEAGFQSKKVYAAFKRGELKKINTLDEFGRKQHVKSQFVSAVTPVPYDVTLLIAAWNNKIDNGESNV